jgi:hypothetical protein
MKLALERATKISACLALAFALGSCQKEPIARTRPPAKARVLDARPALDAGSVEDCGSEENEHGNGYDEARRQCLWRAYETGRPARLTITVHTIEGDPIRYDIVVRSRSNVAVTIDNHDSFGASGKRSRTCTALTKEPLSKDRFTFLLRKCDDQGEPEIWVR